MVELILISLFLILLIYYSLFLLKIYFGLNNLSYESEKIPDEFISVIVPFRNEEKNIKSTFINLSNQDYPANKYEIIFINDFSEDKSLDLLKSFTAKDNVKILSVPDDYSVNAYKKRAIRFGIEHSKGDIIVTTDADCIHQTDWLKNLLKYFDNQTGFVSGPVEFLPEKKLFGKIQRLEFSSLVITGAGLICAKIPTICNAANIAYRKSLFHKVGGFNHQLDLSSGDDELLMQKINKITEYKIKFAPDLKTIVFTNANATLKEFYLQRKRWASKGLFYNDKTLVYKLIFIYLFYLGLILQPILSFLFSHLLIISFLFSVLIKILIEFLILKKGQRILSDKKIINVFLITELFQVPYILIAGISGVFGNFNWKGRSIKR